MLLRNGVATCYVMGEGKTNCVMRDADQFGKVEVSFLPPLQYTLGSCAPGVYWKGH